jgi:hypothetical protein
MAHAVTIAFNAPPELKTEEQVRDWIAENIPLTGEMDADILVEQFDEFGKAQKPCFNNYYRHCGTEWVDSWDSMCNDRCPVCGKEIEPYASEPV